MAGANPQRTSSVSTGVGGVLSAKWVKPLKAYIPQKVQIIAANGLLYVSTANGLYAIDAESGAEIWVYPTEMPLGHSPTISNGIAYVGGFDRKLHALDARTGEGIWTFEAGAGFQTNPLIVDGKVFAGNRDGNLYALDAENGALAWKYNTDGPILFSAAYLDGVIYFASNDSHAYALSSGDGALIWKSAKLPGLGFHSFWPVIYKDYVLFGGSAGFKGKMHTSERDDVFPNWETDPHGTLIGPLGTAPGDWATGTPTIDASKTNEIASSTPITEYLEEKPWRRTLFVLDRRTGEEITYDFDSDGRPEYAPALWGGTTGSGNRYPPVVGNDQVLYFRNTYMSAGSIAGGGITGWQVDTPFLSLPQSRERGGHGDWPVDEPGAISVGGDYLYHTHCCNRVISAIDVSKPNPAPPPVRLSATRGNPRQWRYRNWTPDGYDNQLKPFLWHPDQDRANLLLYFSHGDQNAPVPYNGMVFLHRSNAIIALWSGAAGQTRPAAEIVAGGPRVEPRSVDQLKGLLALEIQKMVAAGHLRPGYSGLGLHNHLLDQLEIHINDYFHNPADTIRVLIGALPYLPPDLQEQTRTYIQAEFEAYPPLSTVHIGWSEGASRDVFDLPELGRGNWPSVQRGSDIQNLYTIWKYAAEFGGASDLYDDARKLLSQPPPDGELAWNPQEHNAYIAGYIGFLELEKLAGQPESTDVKSELERLLALRASTFTADLQHPDTRSAAGKYYYTLLISLNFMNLVPELGEYLRLNTFDQVDQAVSTYESKVPYWFVAKSEDIQGEGVISPLHHYHDLFQAKAQILREPYEDLEPYLDIPAFTIGDLYYIDNLVAAIESGSGGPVQTDQTLESLVKGLPQDNLISNPWFQQSGDLGGIGLKDWLEPAESIASWGSIRTDTVPSPQAFISETCETEDKICGTAASLSHSSADLASGSVAEAILYQVVSSDRSHQTLKFSTYWAATSVDHAEIVVFGGNSPDGPWTQIWMPFSLGSQSEDQVLPSSSEQWAYTDIAEISVENGFSHYKIEVLARLVEQEAEASFNLTGVYFATEAVTAPETGSGERTTDPTSTPMPASSPTPAAPSRESTPQAVGEPNGFRLEIALGLLALLLALGGFGLYLRKLNRAG